MSIPSLYLPQVEPPSVPFLYDALGKRKYLTITERKAFLRAAKELASQDAATFCAALVHTGARISEALELTPSRVDLECGIIVIRSLKKRSNGVYRAVPVPMEFLRELKEVHSPSSEPTGKHQTTMRLWP